MSGETGMIAGGTTFELIGNAQANYDQAKAEFENAAFFEAQRSVAKIAGQRELDVFRRQGNELIGEQTAAFSVAGVDLSGSALNQLSQTEGRLMEEEAAIRIGNALDEKLAGARAAKSRRAAKNLKSFGRNLLQSGTIMAGGARDYYRTQG